MHAKASMPAAKALPSDPPIRKMSETRWQVLAHLSMHFPRLCGNFWFWNFRLSDVGPYTDFRIYRVKDEGLGFIGSMNANLPNSTLACSRAPAYDARIPVTTSVGLGFMDLRAQEVEFGMCWWFKNQCRKVHTVGPLFRPEGMLHKFRVWGLGLHDRLQP